MRRSTRVILIVLVMILAIGLIGCNADTAKTTGSVETTDADQTTQEGTVEESTEGETLSPEEQILEDRRNTVVEYMRNMVSVLWRAEKDFDYTLSTGLVLSIKAGRIYSGIPYTFGCGTNESFLEYTQDPDAKGIYTISGDSCDALVDALNGGSSDSRIGNDCSAAIYVAWAQINASIESGSCGYMYDEYGFIKVGNYQIATSPDTQGAPRLKDTAGICMDNGKEAMFEAYAKLQKGDAVVKYSTSESHAMMITDVKVVYGKDGKIDGKKSIVTVADQRKSTLKNGTGYENEELGEMVYPIGDAERQSTFSIIYDAGYLPITCKELVDPSPLATPSVNDSETELSYEKLLTGTFTSNLPIDAVTLTIKDNDGKVVQEATGRILRGSRNLNKERQREYNLQQLVTDAPGAIMGKVDPEALAAGSYHCTVVCRLMNGQEFVVREFEFTK